MREGKADERRIGGGRTEEVGREGGRKGEGREGEKRRK